MSSFAGVSDVIVSKGLFCFLYADRGSHYWHTPEAGGKVDKSNPTHTGHDTPSPDYSPDVLEQRFLCAETVSHLPRQTGLLRGLSGACV